MATRKTQQLLPEVFRTSKNSKFLNATVDQLISEDNKIKVSGFIGRKSAENFQKGDNYLVESSAFRQNYQLEPGVVYEDVNGTIQSVSSINDALNTIRYNNGSTANQDSLYRQQYYNWSGYVDLDKLINYGEYFWLPSGPDSVQVFANEVDTTQDYTVLRSSTRLDYRFDDASATPNPVLYLARGGEYTFDVEQPGIPFWIQTESGNSGVSVSQKNISTRDVIGVVNNGEDDGTVTWRVPLADDQDRFTSMTVDAEVDFATDLPYKDIHNQVLSAFLATYSTGLDGLTEFDGKTLVFANQSLDERDWNAGAPYDGYAFDSGATEGSDGTFDPTVSLSLADRYSVFEIAIQTIAGVETIVLSKIQDITSGNKVKVKQGNVYANSELWKNASGQLELIPAITASQTEFFYQDGQDATRFGRILLVDQGASTTIDVDQEIIGMSTYTSPNGVVFTNGLKIEFDSSVTPVSYQNNVYYVEGVGTSIRLVAETSLVTPETYAISEVEPYDSENFDVGGFEASLNSPITQDYIVINRASPDLNAWSRGNRWFHRSVLTATAAYNNFTTVIDDNQRAKRPIIEFDAGLKLFNMGITSQTPVSVVDTTQTDAFSNVNGKIGYFSDGVNLTPGLTICFTADPDVKQNIYQVSYIDQDSDTQTDPIINLTLVGTVGDDDCLLSTLGGNNQGKVYYYTSLTDSWTTAQQKTSVNQEPLFDIFDPQHVSFSDTTKYPSTAFAGSKLFSYKRNTAASADTILGFGLSYKNINNVGDILFDNNYVTDTFTYTKSDVGAVDVIIRSGHVHRNTEIAGVVTRELKNGWTKVISESRQWQQVQYIVDAELYSFEIGAQPKTDVNQVTLKVFVNGVFQTIDKYVQLTSNDKYYISFIAPLAQDDIVLIRVYSDSITPLGFYETPANLENNANNDDFASLTLGQLRNHFVDITREIPTFTGKSLGTNNARDLDYKKYPGKIQQHSAGVTLPHFLLAQESNNLIESMRFSMEEYTRFKNRLIDNVNQLDIDLRSPETALDTILTFMSGVKTSEFPFYYSDMLPWGSQTSTTTYTLDQTTERVFEFTTQFDLTEVSHRGVLVYLTEGTANKTQLTEGLDYTFDIVEPAVTLNTAVSLAIGDIIEIIEYSNTDGSFVPPTPTKMGLYPKFQPAITLDDTYQTGTSTGTGPFKLYATADSRYEQRAQEVSGWFYPLYTTLASAQAADVSGEAHSHKFVGSDRLFYMPASTQSHGAVDSDAYTEYANYTPVIQGHDGSRWIAYKDRRDDILIEFEKRVYNNIKTQYDPATFDLAEVVPGYFRSTFADLEQTTQIYAQYISSWAHKNAVDITTNTVHDMDNSFTWNYSNATTVDSDSRMPGYWRGIYKWIYDTETPHLTPWEMLGIYQKPDWWDQRYGVAPYTRGNRVLWEDLEAGKIYNAAGRNATFTVDPYRVRPGLTNIIPTNEQGQLLAPNQFLTEGALSTNTERSWRIGDYAPVETAWRRSSEWPFAMQIIAALKRPAKYMTLLWDTNLLEYSAEYDQILRRYKSYRPNIADFKVNGLTSANSTTIDRVEGYNQFIANFYKYKNLSLETLKSTVQNLKLKLMYPVGGFTDLSLSKMIIESTSPSSTGNNIFIPDENMKIYLNKSTPLERVFYSGVSIIKRPLGYEIRGYDSKNPFFKIVPSLSSDKQKIITVGNTSTVVYADSQNYITSIPYGTVISSVQQVCDFLVAYSRYLKVKGFRFETVNSAGITVDFENTISEFLFWTQQGWGNNSVFGASPAYETLVVDRALTTIDDLSKTGSLKNTDGKAIRATQYNVERIDNRTAITVDDSKNYLYAAQVDPIQYEHYIVLDNTTIFNDIIYQPELGNRQARVKFIGSKSGGWNGTLHAPGFIINRNDFDIWYQNTDYKKADVVSHNTKLYVAKDNHEGKSKFDFKDWRPVDDMKTGMLPNLTQKADRFNKFYDFNESNLEDSVDIAAKGQIGFRKRDYLDQLGLDDVSQVKFYQGMIKTKGTPNVIDKLIGADLNNLDQEINFYEEWGFRVGEYGSIDSNQVIELIIDEARAQENQTVVQLLDNSDTADSDYYTFKKKDIHKLPNNFSKNIFFTRNTNAKKTDIVGAGHPRLDDVNYTLFDLNNIASLDANIDRIGRGATIWTAKNDFDWNVYRVTEIGVEVSEAKQDANGFITLTTTANHGLVENDIVLIKTSNQVVRGFKFVDSVDSPRTFNISVGELEIDDITNLRLPIFKLVSSRFTNVSSIADTTPLYGWDENEVVWVDYDQEQNWAAFKKQEPWDFDTLIYNIESSGNANNGYSVAVADDELSVVSGAPNQGNGVIYPYLKDENGIYNPASTLVPVTIGNDISEFGTSVAAGNVWLAVGAPASDSSQGFVVIYKRSPSGLYEIKQNLRIASPAGADKFGFKVAISKNDRYLFATAPGTNTVYCYTLVNVGTDNEYTETVAGTGSETNYTLGFTPSSIYSIHVVDENDKQYIPYLDYTLSGAVLTFTTAPANGLDIVIRQNSHYVLVDTITGSDSMAGDEFGFSIDSDTAGETLVIGAPYADVPDLDSTVITDAGEAYVFHHIAEKFTANGTDYQFTASNTLPSNFYVEVDGVAQVAASGSFGGFDSDSSANRYTVSGNTISFRYIPTSGSVVKIYTGNFVEMQRLNQLSTDNEPTDNENFGYSVGIDAYGAIVAVGGPGEDELNPNTGSASIFIDEGLRFGSVTTASTDASTFSAQFDSIFIDDYEITVALNDSADSTTLAGEINDAAITTVSAVAVGTTNLTITGSAGVVNKKLKVRPGTGTTFQTLAQVEPFKFTQKVNHPLLAENENFGRVIAFDKHIPANAVAEQRMVISSDRASTELRMGMDRDTVTTSSTYNEFTTTFDADSTKFIDRVTQSGAAYIYDLLDSSATPGVPQSIANPPKFAFGQQMQNTQIDELDQFGGSMVLSRTKLFVGSPTDDVWASNAGSFYYFQNTNNDSTWLKTRVQTPKVDPTVINRIVTYNKVNNEIIDFVDTVDIFKNKLPGLAQQELDYILPIDPATYNVSSTPDAVTFSQTGGWNNEKIGRVWWDLSTCRVIEYEQGDIDYRVQQWNQFFPGSSIDIYEWTESDVLPSQHTDSGLPGTPKFTDDSNYSTSLRYNSSTNTTVTKYYYWVTGLNGFPNNERRQLSTESVRQLIENPISTGGKYLSIVAQNTFVLNNMVDSFADKNTVVSINYDVVKNEGILHTEFDLVSEGDPAQAIPPRIQSKLIDSLAGADLTGAVVPDTTLSIGERYGISIRPRQTMFEDRQQALKTFIDYCNKVFMTTPIARQYILDTLFLSDPTPTKASGAWDKEVADITTRDFLNKLTFAIGYKVLVDSDSTVGGDWTIYELRATSTGLRYWFLLQVQGYNTSRYWNYSTWYATGFDSTTIPTYTVATEPDLARLTASTNELAKVRSNDDGNFSFFQYTDTGVWQEVIIENGTIELKSTIYDYANAASGSYIGFDSGVFDFEKFDRVPHQEVRNIATAIFTDIFKDNLASKRNELFFRMVEFSMHELHSSGLDWLIKTSFLKVLHKVRNLSQYPTYQLDNSTFIEEFINEVKPYHTNIREYTAKYDGDDQFQGDVTDFDLHAFYDSSTGYFRKYSGDFAGDEVSRTTGNTVDKPWADNYSYYLDSVVIYAAGTGFTDNPVITVSAPDLESGTQATVTAVTNGDVIIRVRVTNKGSGYTKTPTITFKGNGTGLTLLPRIKNDTIRDFDTTIKFDRITYSSTVLDWAANTAYNYLDLVSYNNTNTGKQDVYQVNVSGGFTSGTTFSVEDTTGAVALVVYDDANLASAADRIAAYYAPTAGMIGDDLSLLQSGTDYLGNKVSGIGFDREPGFDQASFDNLGFDDFDVDANGLTVLSGASALDTTISSTFTDIALGTRPEDINVDGGGFVDIYSSHAPEEVVPGIVFDNLDMEVYTDPSDDYDGDGNSFTTVSRVYTASGTQQTFSYAGSAQRDLVDYLVVYTGSTRVYDFTADYENRTVSLSSAPAANTNVYIYGYGVTGEKITYEQTFIGDASTVQFTLGINYTRYTQSLVLRDGISVAHTIVDGTDGRIVLTTDDANPNGSLIHVIISNRAVDKAAFTYGETQEITLTSGTLIYNLTESFTGFSNPRTGNAIVELNGTRLRPANAEYYTLDGSTLAYRTPVTAGETVANVATGDIQVTRIDAATNITYNLLNVQDFTVTSQEDVDSTLYYRINLLSAHNSGDTLIVSVRNANEYFINSSNEIRLGSGVIFATNDKLHVTSFNNYDPLRVHTKVYIGTGSEVTQTIDDFDNSGFDSVGFDLLAQGGQAVNKFVLDRIPANTNNLWVTLDGVRLHAGDYDIDESGRLDLTSQSLTGTSEIIVTHFSERNIEPTVGYRMVNDMLGNYEYFRLCADGATKLTQEVRPTDTKIYVQDASKLPQPNPNSNEPGVAYVGNERITYWSIDYTNNYITQIRRATNGTRFAGTHLIGSEVYDTTDAQRLPATNTHTQTWYTAGASTAADGNGIQSATTTNANFLKACEAFVPNYLQEFQSPKYVVDEYVDEGYVADLEL